MSLDERIVKRLAIDLMQAGGDPDQAEGSGSIGEVELVLQQTLHLVSSLTVFEQASIERALSEAHDIRAVLQHLYVNISKLVP